MQAQTIADSAVILDKNQRIIADVHGKTSEETREIVKTICDVVNIQEEIVSLLREMLQTADDAGIYVSDASIHYKVQDLLARLTKEE